MIISFACKETEKIWQGVRSRKLPSDIQERALRKLRQLDVSAILEDLRIPPANHLEALVGDRLGQYTVFALLSSGDSVLFGKMEMLMMLRLLIIIRSNGNGRYFTA